jgi:hypothetical protein
MNKAEGIRLESFEQTAAYHTKAADIAFSTGDVRSAVNHLRAAFHAANNNESLYLMAISKSPIKRYDDNWNKQQEPVYYKAPGGSGQMIMPN